MVVTRLRLPNRAITKQDDVVVSLSRSREFALPGGEENVDDVAAAGGGARAYQTAGSKADDARSVATVNQVVGVAKKVAGTVSARCILSLLSQTARSSSAMIAGAIVDHNGVGL